MAEEKSTINFSKQEEKKLVVVVLTRGYKVYNGGETAGFTPEVAQSLIKHGGATLSEHEDVWTLEDLGLGESKEASEDEGTTPDTRTHDLTVAEVEALVADVTDLTELQGLWEGEQGHPEHEEGRKGALEAIRFRSVQLKEEIEANDGTEGDG